MGGAVSARPLVNLSLFLLGLASSHLHVICSAQQGPPCLVSSWGCSLLPVAALSALLPQCPWRILQVGGMHHPLVCAAPDSGRHGLRLSRDWRSIRDRPGVSGWLTVLSSLGRLEAGQTVNHLSVRPSVFSECVP